MMLKLDRKIAFSQNLDKKSSNYFLLIEAYCFQSTTQNGKAKNNVTKKKTVLCYHSG